MHPTSILVLNERNQYTCEKTATNILVSMLFSLLFNKFIYSQQTDQMKNSAVNYNFTKELIMLVLNRFQ